MSTPKSPARISRRPVTSAEILDVDDQFDACDADGDGRIDFPEFSALLDRLGSELETVNRRRHFVAIDTDGDGCIGRAEFRAWLEG
jgi:Ca2+-binding EF-hand superfamily protein